jgi:hypothetical protein
MAGLNVFVQSVLKLLGQGTDSSTQTLAKLPRVGRRSKEAGATKHVRDELERSGSECRMQLQRRTMGIHSPQWEWEEGDEYWRGPAL